MKHHMCAMHVWHLRQHGRLTCTVTKKCKSTSSAATWHEAGHRLFCFLMAFLCALQLQHLFDSPETADTAAREESPGGQGCSPKGHLSELKQDQDEEDADGHSSGLEVRDSR